MVRRGNKIKDVGGPIIREQKFHDNRLATVSAVNLLTNEKEELATENRKLTNELIDKETELIAAKQKALFLVDKLTVMENNLEVVKSDNKQIKTKLESSKQERKELSKKLNWKENLLKFSKSQFSKLTEKQDENESSHQVHALDGRTNLHGCYRSNFPHLAKAALKIPNGKGHEEASIYDSKNMC